MKLVINIIVLAYLLVSCASIKKPIRIKNTNPAGEEIVKYTKDFENIVKKAIPKSQIDTVDIVMGDIEGPAVGVCTYTFPRTRITLDRTYWKTASELDRESLMLHELTHCVCSVGHVFFTGTYPEKPSKPMFSSDYLLNGYLEDGCPSTIMYPYTLDEGCYKKHREHYRFEIRLQCHSKYYHSKR